METVGELPTPNPHLCRAQVSGLLGFMVPCFRRLEFRAFRGVFGFLALWDFRV